MTKFADLHIHTYFSDSSASPLEVVQEASDQGLTCIAITDHDTMEGVTPAIQAARGTLEVIAGIEISTEMQNKDIHILGYFINIEDKDLNARLIECQNVRMDRMKKMIEKLDELGIKNISWQEVCAQGPVKSLGRPHLANLLIQKGWVKSHDEAFAKYLGEGCPAYVSKLKISPFEAIQLIRQAGGVAVLAHPMFNKRDELIPSFVEAGLEGIEVYYPNSTASVFRYYERIARKHNLVVTGGSDSHGKIKTSTYIGKVKIPYHLVEELRERAKKTKISSS